MDERTIARLYLEQQTPDRLVLSIPGTSYRLHLRPTAQVQPTPQGRLHGVVRGRAWKLDRVSAGGAYIEPIFGRPRRVQGPVTVTIPQTNSVVVEVAGCPFVADLPERWRAAEIEAGSRVGLEIYDGATFEPVPQAATTGQQTADG